MKEKDCWDKFAVSGKIEDYLEYRSSVVCVAHNKADSTQEMPALTAEAKVYGSSRASVSPGQAGGQSL